MQIAEVRVTARSRQNELLSREAREFDAEMAAPDQN